MPPKSEFKVISGPPEGLEKQLAPLAAHNWKPILIASSSAPAPPHGAVLVIVTIILERISGAQAKY